ncbi:hypothetical protein DW081_17270 [Clostridium sp. AF46-9NS]|nr:hypothetical protein DW081_17330 [Clostridium sp. AF46-9NS]RGF25996.1 hypothetical protein DW081_17270 [Clostridium sp. AF46-9NS]RGF31838.1 hypothetical protein DW076_17345 [Clostridium sp. AF46-12NS]RGF35051.1 hypothetical protein DW076_11370 [Clostridium sp. AF46-12NS]
MHYAYNKNGWLVQRTEEIQGNGPVQAAVTRYAYDANGNLTKITTPKLRDPQKLRCGRPPDRGESP